MNLQLLLLQYKTKEKDLKYALSNLEFTLPSYFKQVIRKLKKAQQAFRKFQKVPYIKLMLNSSSTYYWSLIFKNYLLAFLTALKSLTPMASKNSKSLIIKGLGEIFTTAYALLRAAWGSCFHQPALYFGMLS